MSVHVSDTSSHVYVCTVPHIVAAFLHILHFSASFPLALTSREKPEVRGDVSQVGHKGDSGGRIRPKIAGKPGPKRRASLAGFFVCHESAFELVCGADFSWKLMCGEGPGDLEGSRGSDPAVNPRKTGPTNSGPGDPRA